MNVASLFNVSVKIPARAFGPSPAGAEGGAPAGGQERTIGAFITPQSLASFTGATGAISGTWSAINALRLMPDGWNIYTGMVLSLIVGAVIYLINISDTEHTSSNSKRIALIIAFLNTVILFNAARAIVGA